MAKKQGRKAPEQQVQDPYVEEADANPERRNNGCMIYRVGDQAPAEGEAS